MSEYQRLDMQAALNALEEVPDTLTSRTALSNPLASFSTPLARKEASLKTISPRQY